MNRPPRNITVQAQRRRAAAQWLVEHDSADTRPNDSRPGWARWSTNKRNAAEYAAMVALRQQLRLHDPPPAATDEELLRDSSDSPPASIPCPGRTSPSQIRRDALFLPWRVTRLAVGFAALVVVATLFWVAAVHIRPAANNWRPATLVTSIGEVRDVILADGSSVSLEGDTTLVVRFGARREFHLLRGGATFSVHPDPRRPFIVYAGHGTIHALGTQFVVHRYSRFSDRVRVWVTDGAVEVGPAKDRQGSGPNAGSLAVAPVRLTRHQEVAYDASNGDPSGGVTGESNAPALPGGVFMYRGRPLAEVIEDIQRYSKLHITVDATASRLQFTGTVSARDFARWVRGLTEIFPELEVKIDGGSILIRSAAPVRT